MGISFPLSTATFFDRLGFTAFQMSLPPIMERNETEGGEIITVEHGAQLWSGSATCRINPYTDGSDIEALFETLQRSDATFQAYDKLRQWPRDDADGALIATSSPTVSPVADNSRAVRLNGLPSGYVLSRGDLLSFTYASNPTRIGLHRVIVPATANAGNAIAELEVHPPIRSGLANNTALRLVKPICKAKLISYDPPTATRSRRAEISFSWRQTLR